MKLNVLLVEDDKLDQRAFARLVKNSDLPYEYLVAETVQDARNLLQTQPFDVVLIDYELNDGTGFDLLDSVPANVAMIFITGTGSEEIAVKALRAGASDYLVKDQERKYLIFLPLTIERSVQQKRSERQLWTLSQAVMSSSDCIYITDRADNITHVNRAFCDTYAYQPEEIIGKPCRRLLARGSVPKPFGDTGELESFHQSKHGRRFPVSMSHTVVEDNKGIPFANVVIVRDFTERREAEIRIRESEERYRSLVTALAEGIILQDATGRVLTCNESAERILGLTLEDMQNPQPGPAKFKAFREDGTPLLPLDHPALITLKSGESQRQVIIGLQTPADEITWVAMNTEPLWRRDELKPFAVVSSFSDITQLKNTIAERDQLIEHLDSFAHSVAHDLKNPVGLVLGYATLLAQDLEQSKPVELAQSLRVIENAARTMTRIIDALLLLAGTSGMEEVPVDVLEMPQLVEDVQDRLAHLVSEFGAEIKVVTDLPSSLGFAPWVEEILVNYISNALKYGGRPPRVEIGAQQMADGFIRYWVRDNGQGLTPEEQNKLFQPFQRLQRASIDGHGLGLTIVQQIVKRLGGTVAVSSQLDVGSEFSFSLPGLDETAAEQSMRRFAETLLEQTQF